MRPSVAEQAERIRRITAYAAQLEGELEQMKKVAAEYSVMFDNEAMARSLLEADKAELVEALRPALDHVSELEDAWRRGSITECDTFGGTRSNRNVDVRVQLQQQIAKHGAPL